MSFGKDVGFGDLFCGILDGKYLWDGFPVSDEDFNEKMMARINMLKEQADAKNDLRAELNRQDRLYDEVLDLLNAHGRFVCYYSIPTQPPNACGTCASCKLNAIRDKTEKRKCPSMTGNAPNQVNCIHDAGHGGWHEDGACIRWRD